MSGTLAIVLLPKSARNVAVHNEFSMNSTKPAVNANPPMIIFPEKSKISENQDISEAKNGAYTVLLLHNFVKPWFYEIR